MDDTKPWTDLEIYILIRSSREILPTLAELMDRSFEEVVTKYDQLLAIFENRCEEKAKRYVEMGFRSDKAFLKVAAEEGIDLKQLRELGARASISRRQIVGNSQETWSAQ